MSGGRPSRLGRMVHWALLTLAVILLSLAGWVRFRFGAVSLEQILLNLPTQGGSQGSGSAALVTEAAALCLGAPVLLMGAALLVTSWRRRRNGSDGPVRRTPAASLGAFFTALVVFLSVTGVPQYATALLMDRSIAPYYLRPAVAAVAERPHNLVTIYLESGENTFADTSVFGQNLLSELDQVTAGWARYDGLEQYPGGGWTMSGLVSTGCGIPLKSQLLTDGMNLNNLGEALTTYLPGATCLGDILSEQGYTNVFMGGAHTRFAGKDTYLSTHGYDRVLGLDEWEADGEARSQISVWGLSDQRLFERAADVVDDLDESGRPFNLTLLTLDTHEPGGVFPGCSTDDDLAMATATKCSMRAVAGFIDHLTSRGILDDTVVTVMGDHLKATSEGGFFKDELERTPDRTIIYRVWSPDSVRFTRDRADQLSVLPTTLELLGLAPPDGRAGLGVSFVGQHDLGGTALELDEAEYRTVVTSPSSGLYRELWGGQEPEHLPAATATPR